MGSSSSATTKASEVLVTCLGLSVEDIDCLGGGGEPAADAMGVAVVTSLDHGPVRPIPIHGDGHTSAARSDTEVDVMVCVHRGQHLLGRFDVELRGPGGDIAAVEQDVQSTASHPLNRCLVHDRIQMISV